METGSEIASIIMALNMTWNLRIQCREIFLEITRFLQSWNITWNWKCYTHETQIKMPGQCFLWIFLQTNECQDIFCCVRFYFWSCLWTSGVHFYMCCSQVPGCLYSQHVRYKGAKSHCRWSRSWTWSSFDYMDHGSDPTPVWPATILTSFTYRFVLVLANN